MSGYVKNEDLTVEYILKRAINAGLPVSQSLNGDCYYIGVYLFGTSAFESNLISFRRQVENLITYKRMGLV